MAICNITVENDADFYRSFAYQTTDGVPIDLTGATMRMILRKNASDVTVYIELTTDPGEGIQIISPPTGGTFTVLISQAQLEQLPVDDYVHSLIMTAPSGLQTKIWSGTLTTLAGPSR
jgi:hypothetical protein